ncbi:MAG: CBS domain-containing protein [Mycobacterium sp.]
MKVEDLAARAVVSVVPDRSVRQAARAMADRGVGSAVVLTGDALTGILTERDVLNAVADGTDLDATAAKEIMTADVVTVGPDWEVYEAAAEMADKHIRHLVVTEDDRVAGVLSVRDLLLAGQRVQLSKGGWVVLRDPLTFAVRERRKLQRYLLQLRGNAEPDLADLTGLVVGSWSFDLPLPADAQTLDKLPPADREALRAAVLAELPELQRAVHPAPGWRRR